MNMSVNSKNLFHFTKKIKYLKDILINMSFWPRFFVEQGWGVQFAVPMVCFCDIPLSQIKNHIKTYGNYGIGMSKDWALKNGNINPILYVTEEFKPKIKNLLNNKSENFKDSAKTVLSRIKPYSGDYKYNSRKIKKDYLFFQEREWRYVPDDKGKDFECICIDLNLEGLQAKTDKIDSRLHFNANDVKYLFVKNEYCRIGLINTIDKINPKLISNEEKEILKTKIITIEQILNDF